VGIPHGPTKAWSDLGEGISEGLDPGPEDFLQALFGPGHLAIFLDPRKPGCVRMVPGLVPDLMTLGGQ
jgi:hypothetical protein